MTPTHTARKSLAIAAVALVLVLAGCKSKNLPTFPTNTPTPPSAPSSGGLPSPPSGGMPTPPSGQPSPPSPPTGQTSKGGKSGQSGPSTPAPSLPSPGLPTPGAESGGSSDVAKGPKGQKGPKGPQGQKPGGDASGEPAGSETAGTDGGSQRDSRSAAGEDLRQAGEQIAKAGSGEIDPLIPETDSDTNDEGDVFSDSSSASSNESEATSEDSGSAGSENGASDGTAGQVADAGETGGSSSPAGGSPSGGAGSEENTGSPANAGSKSGGSARGSNLPPGLEDEIRRAQEAIAKAGGALQEAGDAVANAETDEELAAAEELLSDARIAVIVATQDLEILEEDIVGTPGWADQEDLFEDTSTALEQANIALVIATRSVLIAKTGSAELPGGIPETGNAGNGRVAVLEDELDESLVIFDGQIGDAREAVLTTTPPPETASSGVARPEGRREQVMDMPPEEPSEDVPEEQQVAVASMPDLNQGDIPDAQGDDIVAQQLREAAMAETDPELQAKLWEEYKRYKEGL